MMKRSEVVKGKASEGAEKLAADLRTLPLPLGGLDPGSLAAHNAKPDGPGPGSLDADAVRDLGWKPPASAAEAFVTHNAKGGPKLAEDFGRIVERVFSRGDAMSEYERLEKGLKLGDDRSDLGQLTKALDESEANAFAAHKLYVQAKRELEAYELDFVAFEAPLRKMATASLQKEKDAGGRSKQITDADVRAELFRMFPEVVPEAEARGAKAKGMVDTVQKLSSLWTSRVSTLATLLANRRK